MLQEKIMKNLRRENVDSGSDRKTGGEYSMIDNAIICMKLKIWPLLRTMWLFVLLSFLFY